MMKVKKKNGTALDCSFLLAALPALTATKEANSLFEASYRDILTFLPLKQPLLKTTA